MFACVNLSILSMHFYMYSYIYTCIPTYICMHIYLLYQFMHIQNFTYIYTFMQIYMVYTCSHISIILYTCISICNYTCFAYIYIYISFHRSFFAFPSALREASVAFYTPRAFFVHLDPSSTGEFSYLLSCCSASGVLYGGHFLRSWLSLSPHISSSCLFLFRVLREHIML